MTGDADAEIPDDYGCLTLGTAAILLLCLMGVVCFVLARWL